MADGPTNHGRQNHLMKHIPFAVLSLVALLGSVASCSRESAASGKAGTRLALSKPADQAMAQGESNKVSVSIDRTGFAEAVRVTFSNLPAGVTVTEDSIPPGDSSRVFVLVASPDAGIVDKRIVTVKAQGAGITTSQTFELSVKAKG